MASVRWTGRIPKQGYGIVRKLLQRGGQLTAHLHDFIDAYNYARRLKTLRGLTPYEYICKIWATEPERFTINSHHQMPGPNTHLPKN